MGPTAAGLHLAHEEYPDADQEQHREPIDQNRKERRHLVIRLPCLHLDALRHETLDQLRIVRRDHIKRGASVLVETGDLVAFDDDGRDFATVDFRYELRIGHFCLHAAPRGALEQVKKSHHQNDDDNP